MPRRGCDSRNRSAGGPQARGNTLAKAGGDPASSLKNIKVVHYYYYYLVRARGKPQRSSCESTSVAPAAFAFHHHLRAALHFNSPPYCPQHYYCASLPCLSQGRSWTHLSDPGMSSSL